MQQRKLNLPVHLPIQRQTSEPSYLPRSTKNTFIWNTGNLRKTDSSVFALEDFASAGLAGRIGEAIAYLTMIKWGYVFWDRCATVWERAARGASINHSEQLHVAQYLSSQVASGRPQNEPDFIFEKSNGDVALMEAKGSFVNPAKDNPSTKADLNQSLKQLAAWSSVIAPTPQKSYGIGTYLREEHDNNDPSLIAYVDPPGKKKETIQPAELPPDLVRRCNYGAWLEGMGLVSSGRALRDGRGRKIEEITLPTVEIDGRGFVFRHAGFVTSTGQNSHFLAPWDWLNYALNRGHVSGILVMGVDVRIMHIISQSIQNPKASMLKEINSGEATGHLDTRHRESPWSIMPDGSFFGIVDLDTFHKGIEEAKTFNL